MVESILAVWTIVSESFRATIRAVVILSFPILVGVCFTVAVVRLLGADVDKKTTVLYGIVFGIFGLSVAYISRTSETELLAQVMPPAIAGVIVLFQLLGRLNPNWDVPLESQASLVGATAGVFCFIFGSVYFLSAPLPSQDVGTPIDPPALVVGGSQGEKENAKAEPGIPEEEAVKLME